MFVEKRFTNLLLGFMLALEHSQLLTDMHHMFIECSDDLLSIDDNAFGRAPDVYFWHRNTFTMLCTPQCM